MGSVLAVTLPFFALVLTGYGAGRWRILDAAGINGLTRFVFYFALPCMLFGRLAQTSPSVIFNGPFLAAYVTAALVTLAIGAAAARTLFRSSIAEASVIGLSASYSNIGFMGIPLLVAAVGDFVAVPLALMLTIDLILLVPLAMLLIEWDQDGSHRGQHLGRIVFGVFLTNPLVIAIFLGILAAVIGLALPGPIYGFIGLLGDTAGPCAMFALGATLAGRPVTGYATMAMTMSAGKLVLHPLVMAAVMTVFGIATPWLAAAVLGAGMPMAAVLFVIAQQYDVRPAVASTAVLASTALSILTLSGLVALMSGTGMLPAN